jgi:pimeloyl-ACP methyl ester carboxylesterase
VNVARSTYIDAAGYEMHVTEWGDPSKPALVMWHGLARTGRDFDEAATALSDSYFILCPDTLGRGLSAWARNGASDYTFATYGAMTSAMLDHYRIERLGWIGTSMGGLLGITLAAGPLREKITHLVINDVGPDIPAESAQRIVDYVGNPPAFDSVLEYEAWLRATYAPFGANSNDFWRRMAETSLRRTSAGKITVHYDPAIVSLMGENNADLDVWDDYDALSTKTLLFRGEHSDVLPLAVAEEMVQRGPRPVLVDVAECGHAPTLATSRQTAVIREFVGS